MRICLRPDPGLGMFPAALGRLLSQRVVQQSKRVFPRRGAGGPAGEWMDPEKYGKFQIPYVHAWHTNLGQVPS